jgi:hypothetical protein
MRVPVVFSLMIAFAHFSGSAAPRNASNVFKLNVLARAVQQSRPLARPAPDMQAIPRVEPERRPVNVNSSGGPRRGVERTPSDRMASQPMAVPNLILKVPTSTDSAIPQLRQENINNSRDSRRRRAARHYKPRRGGRRVNPNRPGGPRKDGNVNSTRRLNSNSQVNNIVAT